MTIYKNIDIEEEIRQVLSDHFSAYVRPLPKSYDLPNLLITQVGGSVNQRVSTFEVVLDARAEHEAGAMDTLNHALAVLEAAARYQTCRLRYMTINSSGSWGKDPVRPDLSMCSARISVRAHQIKEEV